MIDTYSSFGTMSLSLLDSQTFESIPEEFDGVLDGPNLAICCQFSRRGGLFAVGCNDGKIVIWDILTRSIGKIIDAHGQSPVCAVSWSRNCHRLVSAGLDNFICIWEVLSGACLTRMQLPSPILKVQFNPRNDRMILVSPLKYQSVLIYFDYDLKRATYKILPAEEDEIDESVISSFDKRGQYIYSGNSGGRITITCCPKTMTNETQLTIKSSFLLQSNTTTLPAIRDVEFPARNKTYFIVNATDRAIRLYDCRSAFNAGIRGSCQEIRRFQDLVNKTMWRKCCFSGDTNASYICAGSARQHELCIWETSTGSIKKSLQGTRGEILLDVQWHPFRPIVMSISSGLISVWSRPQIENWSAFAPDFKELEENMEYEEKESEFDAEDEDNPHRVDQIARETNTDSEMVDVLNLATDKEFLSSDEEEIEVTPLDYIPIELQDIECQDETACQPFDLNVNEEKAEEVQEVVVIPIVLENPPTEAHPLSLGSSKRIRLNEKLINPSRKSLKIDKNQARRCKEDD